MSTSRTCEGCGEPTLGGQRVFQLAAGQYIRAYITPTYDAWRAVEAEWHERCFREAVSFQARPYICVTRCSASAETRQAVRLVDRGLESSDPPSDCIPSPAPFYS